MGNKHLLSIVDMQISNIVSVSNAFTTIGMETEITTDVNIINNAAGIILPGVGAFEEGMNFLNNNGLSEAIHRRVCENGVPILGICLGMQLLGDTSTEYGDHDGLGLVEGQIIKLDPADPATDFYENKHLNSDLIACNFTDLTDEEMYQALTDANNKLINAYFDSKRTDYIEMTERLYSDKMVSFRGYRRYDSPSSAPS